MKPWHRAVLLSALLVSTGPAASRSDAPSQKEVEEWFNAPPEKSAADVNEGELRFLMSPPNGKPVHHHHNAVTITSGSLSDGWAVLNQCHENLDQVSALQIVFNPERIRALQIESFSGIREARVEGASIQLRDIGPAAKLCLRAEGRALRDNGDGTYTLMSGPFMRKFLDGYYPMHVSMNVRLLTRELRFLRISPPVQDGFRVWQTPEGVNFDAWFEGRLHTEISFVTRDGFPRF